MNEIKSITGIYREEFRDIIVGIDDVGIRCKNFTAILCKTLDEYLFVVNELRIHFGDKTKNLPANDYDAKSRWDYLKATHSTNFEGNFEGLVVCTHCGESKNSKDAKSIFFGSNFDFYEFDENKWDTNEDTALNDFIESL